MFSSPEQPAARRLLLTIGALVTVLLLAILFWSGTLRDEAHARKKSKRSVSASSAQHPNASTRSRMIEADAEEKPKLSAKDNAATDWRKAFALADRLNDREKGHPQEKATRRSSCDRG
ncbi:MAG TPA: hypothetical protein VF585_09220 [Chthoniobacterales bacterium]|jgi:cell division protein FtsN